MSRTEVHKGTVVSTGLTVEEFLKKNIHLVREYYRDEISVEPVDVFYNGLVCDYDTYVILNDLVYHNQGNELDGSYFTIGKENPDGSLDYFVSFYNGGCSLSEAIQEAYDTREVYREL